MPIHIKGAGGGGTKEAKKTLTAYLVNLSSSLEQHTFVTNDLEFAKNYNAAKSTKHFDIVVEPDGSAPITSELALYHAHKGVILGSSVSNALVCMSGFSFALSGSALDLTATDWVINDTYASFALTLSNAHLEAGCTYYAVWTYDE